MSEVEAAEESSDVDLRGVEVLILEVELVEEAVHLTVGDDLVVGEEAEFRAGSGGFEGGFVGCGTWTSIMKPLRVG